MVKKGTITNPDVSCGIFILNHKNKVLIAHPPISGGRLGSYSIPKGGMEESETYEQTAIRETKEECNIDVSPHINSLRYIGNAVYKHRKKVIHCFAIKLPKEYIDICEVKCNTFTNNGDPELCNFKWSSTKKAKKKLHYCQSGMLEIIENHYNIK